MEIFYRADDILTSNQQYQSTQGKDMSVCTIIIFDSFSQFWCPKSSLFLVLCSVC